MSVLTGTARQTSDLILYRSQSGHVPKADLLYQQTQLMTCSLIRSDTLWAWPCEQSVCYTDPLGGVDPLISDNTISSDPKPPGLCPWTP